MKNKTTISYIMSLILIGLISIFLISGCTSEKASDNEAVAQETVAAISTDVQVTETIRPNTSENTKILDMSKGALSLEGYGAVGALEDKDLSLVDMLMYAVQDEYLAHGEYLTIISAFGEVRPYTNIVKAEETHLSYLKEIYQTYGLAFPEDTSADHVIVPTDLLAAAKTGVQAEIDNIAMYALFMSYNLPEDVSSVFVALEKGSESHLSAFQKQVDKLE